MRAVHVMLMYNAYVCALVLCVCVWRMSFARVWCVCVCVRVCGAGVFDGFGVCVCLGVCVRVYISVACVSGACA